MGIYNSEYENYYNSIKRKNTGGFENKNRGSKFGNNWIAKRLIVDLSGVLFLLVFIMGCKIMATPKTIAVYNYSKNVVSINFDYKSLIFDFKKNGFILDNGSTTKESLNEIDSKFDAKKIKNDFINWLSKFGKIN